MTNAEWLIINGKFSLLKMMMQNTKSYGVEDAEILITISDVDRYINLCRYHKSPAVGWETVLKEANKIYKAILSEKSK